MKKIIALLVFAVMILLTFSSCADGNTSSTEVSSKESTSSENINLSDENLARIVAENLEIPEYMDLTYTIGEILFWEAGGTCYRDISFYECDEIVAGASVDPATGELLRNILKYDNTIIPEGSFYDYFEDRFFAWYVACIFDKSPREATTEEELASYKGGVTIWYYGESIKGIGYLKSITELHVSKNEITEIPSEITNCKNLKRLELLKSCSLVKLPENIGDLENLEFLRVSITNVEKLPESIGNLKNLKYLYAVDTGITNVPESIGNCENLVALDLHGNKISEIPDSITKLKKLKSLDLGWLDLTSLPENMGDLTELIRLDLFGSDIKQLPQSMKNLKKLEYLNVYDNYNLNEDYKQWFENECYKCTTDPENSKDWDDGI